MMYGDEKESKRNVADIPLVRACTLSIYASRRVCHVVVEAVEAAAPSAENIRSTWQCPPDFYYFGVTMDIYYFG